MSKIKTGLGRGLDALINPKGIKNASQTSTDYSDLKKDDGESIDVLAKIPVNLISSNPFQPRTRFDEEALDPCSRTVRGCCRR